jgi:hypothetical protein
MKNLKRLGVSFTLMCVLAVVALGGETSAPPCATEPGETQSPPCAAAQMLPGNSVDPGQTSTPPAASAGTEFSVSDMALSLVQSVLSIF